MGACGRFETGNVLDGVSITLGHEIAETITDPYGNNFWNINAWYGWDTNGDIFSSAGFEIGDLCQWQNIIRTPSTWGGQMFATQPLYSDRANNCIQMTAAIGMALPASPFVNPTYHYLTAVNGGGLGENGSVLQTDRQQALSWETFGLHWAGPVQEWFLAGPQQFGLQTTNGPFVTAVDGGGIGGPNNSSSPIHTDATKIGPWELFRIAAVPCSAALASFTPDACVTLQTLNGDFVTAQFGGGMGGSYNIPIWTDINSMGQWEILQILPFLQNQP